MGFDFLFYYGPECCQLDEVCACVCVCARTRAHVCLFPQQRTLPSPGKHFPARQLVFHHVQSCTFMHIPCFSSNNVPPPGDMSRTWPCPCIRMQCRGGCSLCPPVARSPLLTSDSFPVGFCRITGTFPKRALNHLQTTAVTSEGPGGLAVRVYRSLGQWTWLPCGCIH